MTKQCSRKARELIVDACKSPLYVDGKLAPAFLALQGYVADLEEAVYGPRDMTRNETDQCQIKRLREERDGFRETYHEAHSARAELRALLARVGHYLTSANEIIGGDESIGGDDEDFADAAELIGEIERAVAGAKEGT